MRTGHITRREIKRILVPEQENPAQDLNIRNNVLELPAIENFLSGGVVYEKHEN
jgi:hypothetical protein